MNFSSLLSIFYYIQSLFTTIHINHAEECLHDNTNITNFLASRTPYRVRENRKINPLDIVPAECEPVQIWMLVRHACRYPNEKEIIQMNDRLPKLKDQILMQQTKGTLCSTAIEKFRNWNFELKPEDKKGLTKHGEKELIALIKRMKIRFPNLITGSYSNDSYVFRSTRSKHIEENARFFVKTLFDNGKRCNTWNPKVEVSDPILDFYNWRLTKWLRMVPHSAKALQEKSSFLNGETYQALLHEVEARLGISEISIDDMVLIYKMCQYETSWMKNDVSPWCLIFTDNNLQVLEYVPDLVYYYKYGYGYEGSCVRDCDPFLQNMLQAFKTAEEGSSLKGTFNMANSAAILHFLTHLGLYRDETPLLHSNFVYHREHRKWRVGHFDTCVSNIAAVLHRCGNNDYRVLMLHQERVITVPGCPKNQLCPLNVLRKNFPTCDFDEICKNEINSF